MVEAVATALMTFISGQFGVTIMGFNTPQVAAYVGIFNTILLAVFIYASAPASGGHLNPTITWTTMLCGLCPASRGRVSLPYSCPPPQLPLFRPVYVLSNDVPAGVLYILFQTLGGALGGGLLRGSWGYERAAL